MRSSSVKTFVSVVTLTFTLAVAAPPAQARPSQPQRATQAAPKHAGMSERVQRVMRQLLKRVFGISANGMPGDPIPRIAPGESTTSEAMPGDPIPDTMP